MLPGVCRQVFCLVYETPPIEIQRGVAKDSKNGQLLEAAETAKFDVLLTVDRGFEYQQNLAGRRIALIVFCGKSVLFEDLLPLMPACLDRLKSIRPGEVVRIGD